MSPNWVAFLGGAALMLLAAVVSGRQEAWDSGLYWLLFYPLSLVACAVLGYRNPGQPARSAFLFFLGQCVAMLLRNGELGNLFPIGLLMFGILALPGVAAAKFGAKQNGSAPAS